MARVAALKQSNRIKNGDSKLTSNGGSVATAKKAVTKRKDTQHVVEENGQWIVKSARSGRFVTKPYLVKSDAIDAGRRLARSSGSDLLVHGPSGQIFRPSPAPSDLQEDSIRDWVRAAASKKSVSTRKSPDVKRKAVARKK